MEIWLLALRCYTYTNTHMENLGGCKIFLTRFAPKKI